MPKRKKSWKFKCEYPSVHFYKVQLASTQERLSSLRGDISIEGELGVQGAREHQAVGHLLEKLIICNQMGTLDS